MTTPSRAEPRGHRRRRAAPTTPDLGTEADHQELAPGGMKHLLGCPDDLRRWLSSAPTGTLGAWLFGISAERYVIRDSSQLVGRLVLTTSVPPERSSRFVYMGLS